MIVEETHWVPPLCRRIAADVLLSFYPGERRIVGKNLAGGRVIRHRSAEPFTPSCFGRICSKVRVVRAADMLASVRGRAILAPCSPASRPRCNGRRGSSNQSPGGMTPRHRQIVSTRSKRFPGCSTPRHQSPLRSPSLSQAHWLSWQWHRGLLPCRFAGPLTLRQVRELTLSEFRGRRCPEVKGDPT